MLYVCAHPYSRVQIKAKLAKEMQGSTTGATSSLFRYSSTNKTGRLHQFFPRIALPMLMVVDLESMTLVHAEIGWNLESFESLVSDRLSSGANTP
jgi:hypothetical protein